MSMTINSIEDLESQPEARANQPAPAPEPVRPDIAPQVRAAINVARESRLTADTVNRAIATGRRLGLPMRVVANSLDLAQQEELARRIDSNEMLSTWVDRDPYRAAIAAGDTEKIENLFNGLQNEYLHRKAQRNDLNGFQKFCLLLEEGIQDVANSMEAGVTGAVRALGQTQFTDDEGSRSAPFAEATASWADTMDRQRDAFVKAQPPRLEAQTTFGGYLQDIARMFPQVLGAAGAFATGGPTASLAFMGNQIAGSTYDKLRRDGVDTNRAFLAGLGNAALQAPLEQIGLGRIMNVFKASGLKNIAKGSLQGAATEGFTEFLQAYPESATELWAKLGENEGAKQWFEQFTKALPETTRQGIYEGLVAAPFGIFGGIGRAVQENAMNRFVENFQQRQIDFHDKVDALREGGMDVSVIENACDHGGMGTELGISAQGLIELHQSGRDLITPLELNLEDVLTAAEAGQDIIMPLAKMHASLDRENFAALAPHIRPSLYGPTAVEAAENPVNMADVQRVAELYQDNRNLFAELDAEKARLKEELRVAMNSSPNLQAQAAGFGGFDKFADDWLSMVERYALRMGTSQDPIETMRRITLDEIRARASAEPANAAEPAVAPEVAATKRLAPETRKEEADVQEPAREADDFNEWLAAQEPLVNPFEDANTPQTAQPETAPMPENATEAAEEAGERRSPEPIAWDLMLDENYLSENALMDLDMTRYAADTAFLTTNKNELPVLAPGMPYKKYREGLARWRKKYPNSPGLKEVEEHLDWIESVAKAEGQELYQGIENQTQDEAFASGNAAMEKVLSEHIDALDAMWRKEVGSISFYWGTPGRGKKFKGGSGISHLIAHRNAQGYDGEAIARKMPEVLAYGKESKTQGAGTQGERRFFTYNGYTAVVSLYKFENRQTWLLTGWIDENTSDAQGEGYDSQSATSNGPTLTRSEDGAEAEINVKPLGVDGKPLFHGGNNTDTKRGSVQIYPESYLISLFEKADLSTLLHETGHIFFEEMERLVKAGAADASVIADYKTMRGWLGAKEGEQLTTEQREQAARGFEAYLMEGKAPTPELQSAFRRFKKWLLRIYQSAVGLRVELNDDVRAVFSRMISTEQEINRAASENELLELTAKEISALGLTDNEAAQINAASANAREQAAEALQNARDANRIERRAKYAKEAAAELAENQTYIARRDLRKTPLDIDAIMNNFGENLAKALRKKLPATTKKDGADPEIFAAQHGYKSADEMFTDILNSQTKGEAIREIVDRKEAESDASYSAMEALLDTQDISTQMDLVGRKLADLVGVQQIERQAYTVAAQQELARMPVGKATQTGRYMAAMRRNILSYRRALLAGDREKALDFNRKALLNYEFAKQSRDLSKSTKKFVDATKRFVGSKTADPDVRFLVMEIASKFGVVRENEALARGREFGELLPSWLADVQADGYDLFLNNALIGGEGRPWRELTVTELEDLTETITQITTVERNRRKLLTAQGKQDLQEVAENIAQSILAHNKTKAVKTVENEPKAVEFLKGLHAIHTKVEALCLAVDGGKMGPTWEHIYKPITEAEDVQARRFRDVSAKLKDMFKVYSRKELSSMGVKKEFVEEIRESVTFENRLAVALNMGNAENIERLKVGHNWDDAKIAAVVKTLTERDWKFVQSVWDYLDTFKEESFNLQQEITGMRPKAVEAQPFQVTTSDGVVLEMKGGYYPISYNPKKGERAFGENQKELDKELFGGRNYGQAQTKQGHLKARAGQGQGTPLQLDLSVMTNHVFNVVHDLSYRKAVLDVAKVIRNKTVQDAFTSTVGPQMYRQLRPWLQDIANERQEPMHAVNKWANWARTSTTIMQMGYKATTMFMQPLGITQTMDAIGYRWTAYGIGKVFGNVGKFSEMLQETYARSPFMQNRAKSFDREVRDITKKIKPSMGRFGWIDVIRDKAFVPMGALQMGVDLPTWWGAYAKGLKENGGDEKKAALYADMIVRTCQGSGTTKDLAGVQRGSELQKLFTMFYSYFNTLYNIGARHIRELRADPSPAGILKAANAALLLWFVPVVLGEIVAGRGPEDDEEWWKWSAPLLIQYPFQTIVGVKDVMAGICGEYGYQLSAAQSAPGAIVRWAKSIMKAIEKEDASMLIKPSVELFGYATSLPLKQAIISVQNLWDWFAGNDPDWYWRDLLFVKPKDRR